MNILSYLTSNSYRKHYWMRKELIELRKSPLWYEIHKRRCGGELVMKGEEMTAEEKLKELALFEEYKEAFACGSTNMDFKTWCWYRAATTIAATTLHLDRPNS